MRTLRDFGLNRVIVRFSCKKSYGVLFPDGLVARSFSPR